MSKEDKEKKEEEIIELVIARLEVIPSDRKISIGSEGEFTKNQLIEHVKKNDDLGKKIVEIELKYLKLLKEGLFYEHNSIDNQTLL